MSFFILLVYYLLSLYVIWRFLRWLSHCHPFFNKKTFRVIGLLIYLVLCSSIVAGLYLPVSKFQIYVLEFSNYWLGFFLNFALIVFLADIVLLILRGIRKLPRRSVKHYTSFFGLGSMTILVCSCLLSFYGLSHAKEIKTKQYDISIEKTTDNLDNLRIGLISDLHLGTHTDITQIKAMVDTLNQQGLDLVCIAGGIYDTNFDTIEEPDEITALLGQIESTHGTYACYGDTDVNKDQLRDTRLDRMMEQAGITVLKDEALLIDRSFYLIGRLDHTFTGVQGLTPKTIDEFTKTLDQGKPIIVLEHQPIDLQEEASAGVDLSLAGHTHGGQMFPGTLLSHFYYENPYGLLQIEDYHSIVTSGIGTHRTNMRIGTDSEVVILNITF